MYKLKQFLLFVAMVLAIMAFTLLGMAQLKAEPSDHKTQSERISKAPWTLSEMNDVVNQANFILRGCSGTLISKEHGLILTAHHCIDGSIRFVEGEEVKDGKVKKVKREVRSDVTVSQKFYAESTNVGSTEFESEIVAYNEDYDLALLQVRADNFSQTKEIPILPKGMVIGRGQPVYVIGNPAGLDATVTTGVISSATREIKRSSGKRLALLQSDAGAFYGSSGGSMVTDTGYLIGVISQGIPSGSVILAVHYKHIRDFLSENCWGQLWDSEADDKKCLKKKEPKDDDEESLEDLLRKLLKKKQSE